MRIYFILAIITLLTSQHLAVPMGTVELKHCHIKNYGQEVLCGKHTVYEDRTTASGRQIEIQFAIIPSVTEAKEADPLVIFAGGPGQGAMDMGRLSSIAFSEIHENRDVVLIDQRGMGNSHPLKCKEPEESALSLSEEELEILTRKILKECLTELDADVTKYTQDIANHDIHEILMALGYKKVNLYGVSWGTRSALLYANQFPDHVRSVIMDGNAPIENKVPLYATEDAEKSIQMLFSDCNIDTECHKAFPNLQQDFESVLAGFGEQGKETTINDPNTGKAETITLTRGMFVNALRNILYSPDLSRLIPIVIEQAKDNNYQALAALSTAFGDTGMAIGATLTILCSEELARVTETDIAIESSKGFVGGAFINNFKKSCDQWPKAPLPAIYHQTLTSDAPTLILSGDVDPVTPPRWGDKMAQSMTNSLHLVATNTGHNVAPKKCASKLMAQFVKQGNFDGIDGECLKELKRPSFFIDANGPARSVSND